ncbi:MAG: efflux RND transporter periplasmic adaptor subunit [Verrucomicrobiales bacterium]|nr:efflux RND transporter periplasmic adaptor subunit [Verrucomicrobiales bacterium]
MLLSSCGDHHEPTSPVALPEISVETKVVEAEEIPVFAEVVGTVRPRKEARVASKVTGRILEMTAIPGKRVEEGDVLARIEVAELKAALDRAEAALNQADRDLARYRSVAETGAVAKAEIEQAESRQRMASATVAETRIQVENASVTAPFSGTVTRKLLEPGDFASPDRAIFAMEDSSLLQLEINVAESLASTVNLEDEFRIEVAGADADLNGEVSEISPSADVGSRTFSIKLDLPEKEELRAGQFGRAFLPRANRVAILVPESSVISRGQMDYVFVAAGKTARLRIVRTGESREGRTEILSGLDGGETFILNPPVELQDGQPLVEK